MCAIAGVFKATGVDPRPVKTMTHSMDHRGPDARTIRRYGGQSPYAAIGVQRLAIVDVAHGVQPAQDPSGRYRVALNGEIYNHKQLRQNLVANGAALKSHSDTEVVAALIARNGLERALSMCHGMFAMAVLDTQERHLFLVRDRMGVKPLHWTQLPDGTIAFASEIKGLMAHPAVQRSLNPDAVESFLMFEYVPSPLCIWSGFHKVQPGTWMRFSDEGTETFEWWSKPTILPGRPGNFDKWAKSLHGALQVAVNSRCEADVPIGFLLSGGLDSAAVATMAARVSTTPLQTFSLSISADGFDEGEQAAHTAAAIGATHHDIKMGPRDLEPLLKEITAGMDEPLADSSLIATWRLMAAIKTSGIKCVLSGDGADEVLGGYPTYFAHRLAGPAAGARGLLKAAIARLPVRTNGVTQDYMARRFVLGLGLPWQRRHQVWMGSWLAEEINASAGVWSRPDQIALTSCADPIGRAMALDQQMYLADGVLVKVDRAAGAHGIEVRSPFLDHTVVELAASMGTGHHIRGIANKRVLRAAMAELLPTSVLERPKKGFGTPVGPWLKGHARHLLDDLPERTAPWIPPATCARVVQEHCDGIADHRRRLWTALTLAQWVEGPHGLG
jgi:asparagine synthase (glutamine-hydrolysing)